jgi:lipid II:glycine glycyltransferase (peptidoglycan interpeptide bridge formation enzyme)
MGIFLTVEDKEKFESYKKILSNWSQFSKEISQMTENQIKECLYVETKTKKRLSIMLRIKGRLNVIRNKREVVDLIKLSND